MIIGNGLIAEAFKKVSVDFKDCIIFASGVSNSKSENSAEFKREFDLIKKYKNEDKKFIYFSTIHTLDPSERDSKYSKHKIEIGIFIKENFKSYIIYRLPVVVGRGGNKKSLFNFLFHNIIEQKDMTIFIKAYRYILDIDSVVYFIQKTYHIQNETIDIVQDKPFTIFEIVESFERCLNLKAKYHTVNKGDYFKVDNSKFKKSLLNQKELDRYSNISYLDTIIKKYY